MSDLNTNEDMPSKGSIAVTSWGGHDSAVYYTDTSGGIRERTYHKGDWSGGTTSDIIFSGKNTTPLAVMQWFWNANGYIPMNSIRVYYLDPSHMVHEICWDGQINSWPQATPPANWFAGELDQHSCYTAGNTKLASVHWGAFLRVYYQSTDGSLREHCRDYQNPWYAGSSLPSPSGAQVYDGTALAAFSRNPSSPEIFVFFQGNDGSIYEAKYNGNWTTTGSRFAAKKGTALAVAALPGENAIRVYAADPDGLLAQYTGEPNDFTKKLYPGPVSLLEGSALAAQVVQDSNTAKYKVRLYHFEKDKALSKEAATNTPQGKKVLSGRNVTTFLNVSYLHWEDESHTQEGGSAVAEFD